MERPLKERREQVERGHELPLSKQCELLTVHRSRLYYKPVVERDLNFELMRRIDERFLLCPWMGVPRMTQWLRPDQGYEVNLKRVVRPYKLMDLQAIGPKPNTSKPGKGHRKFPYLLRGLKVRKVNKVWAMDITYVPVNGGFLYLCTVSDRYSRYVVNWSLSNTMTAEWCRSTLEEATDTFGAPEILNMEQGGQFTSDAFTDYVTKENGIRLSRDGKGRSVDKIFIERLCR